MRFVEAQRLVSPARIGIVGGAGAGKTYSALRLARGLAGDGRIAVIDTDRRACERYADRFDFDRAAVDDDYAPRRIIDALTAAVEQGYDVVVVDTLSPAWDGPGGTLDLADRCGWKQARPLFRELTDAITSAPAHVVVTVRIREAETSEGRSTRKLAMDSGLAYDLDVMFDLADDHSALVAKTRYSELDRRQLPLIDERVGAELAQLAAAGARFDVDELKQRVRDRAVAEGVSADALNVQTVAAHFAVAAAQLDDPLVLAAIAAESAGAPLRIVA